jgi:hypothetical protein
MAPRTPKPGSPRDPFLIALRQQRARCPDVPLVVGIPDGGTRLRILCPYCARCHHHGGYGHRHAHCGNQVGVSSDDRMKGYFIAPAWLFHLLLEPPRTGWAAPAPPAAQLDGSPLGPISVEQHRRRVLCGGLRLRRGGCRWRYLGKIVANLPPGE